MLSCTERTSQGQDFEMTLTVKMETRHPVEGPFGREFPAICNHCGVMNDGLKSQDLDILLAIFAFFEKRSLSTCRYW